MRILRLHYVLMLAKLLRVPVSVGYSWMASGKNDRNAAPGLLM
jgi:hypothetical protein